MKRNDRGFTLIELIVVVAILAVCVAMGAVSLGSASSAQARSCASKLDAKLSQARVGAMSRAGDVYLELYHTDSGVYCTYVEEKNGISETEKLGGARLAVSYSAGGADTPLGDESAPLRIAFSRVDGSLLGSPPCTEISVSAMGSTYSVVIYPTTGSHGIGGVA